MPTQQTTSIPGALFARVFLYACRVLALVILWILVFVFGILEVVLLVVYVPSPIAAGVFVGWNALLAFVLGLRFAYISLIDNEPARRSETWCYSPCCITNEADDDGSTDCQARDWVPQRSMFTYFIIAQHVFHYFTIVFNNSTLVTNSLLWILYAPLSPFLFFVTWIIGYQVIRYSRALKEQLQANASV